MIRLRYAGGLIGILISATVLGKANAYTEPGT
jgi:hypothetical protein